MKRIVSLSDAIPADIAIIKELLSDTALSNKTTVQILKLVDKHLKGAKEALIEKALNKLGLNEGDLKDALEFWNKLNKPIGQTEKDKTWDIDWDTSKTMGSSVPISLNVSAIASTAFRINNKNEALQAHQIQILDTDVLVNHEVKLGGVAGISANASVSFIGVEVGAQYSGELEVDTFSQYPTNTSSIAVLREYFFSPLKVWDLDDVEDRLILADINNQSRGLRKLSINTQGSFKLNGKLSLGKAWSLSGEGKAQELSADINANIGFSKSYEHNGNLKLEFEKGNSNVDGQPILRAKVYLLESSMDTNAFNLNVNASIKGLDRVAGKYVNKLLKEGDELVSLLEEWSQPSNKIIGKASDRLDKNKWYTPVAKLLLGTTTADDAAKKLIDDELSEILDRYMQSPNLDSEKLARKSIEKLLDIFSVEGQPSLIDKAKKELSSKIDDWKKDLDTELKARLSVLSDSAKLKLLQPLESLGSDVSDIATKSDAKISAAIKKGLVEYQSLKERITNALEKSANIKLGLSVEASRYKAVSDEQWIEIEFLDTSHATVNRLYRKLVLGDSNSASRILATLEDKGLVRINNQAVALGMSSGSKLSFDVDLGGLQLSKVKNVNSELRVKVTNTGSVVIESKIGGNAISKGFGEVRSASANLVYGLAQQAQSPDEIGNLSISYSNVDNQLFSLKEIQGILKSLDFSDNERLEEQNIDVPRLVDAAKILDHLNWYKQARKWKHAKISSVEITVPTNKDLYETLLNVNANKAYRVTCRYWYTLFTSARSKRIINTIIAAYAEEKNIDPYLTDVLQHMEDKTDFDRSDIKGIACKSDTWGKEVKKLNQDAWRKNIRLLRKIYETADSMRIILDSIKSIDDVVTSASTVSGNVRERAEYLCEQLYPLNKKVEECLKLWIDVEGVIDDLFSQEINQTMLCFYLILAKLTGKEESFIRTLITVSGSQDQRKIRVVL